MKQSVLGFVLLLVDELAADLVFLGDGYTIDQMDLYHQHVADKWRTIAATEPFTTYASFFRPL